MIDSLLICEQTVMTMLPHCPALLSPFSVHLLLLTLGKYMMMMMT